MLINCAKLGTLLKALNVSKEKFAIKANVSNTHIYYACKGLEMSEKTRAKMAGALMEITGFPFTDKDVVDLIAGVHGLKEDGG